MSRTLSIDKIGPGPGFLGQALPLSQPSCGDLGVSPTLVFALISARGCLCAGQSVATAGVTSVDSAVSCRGWRLGRSQKNLGLAPTASDMAAGWDGSLYVGASVLDLAHRPAPARELAGGGDVALFLWTPRSASAPPLDEPSHALGRVPSRRRACPLARSFERGEQPGVPRRLDRHAPQVLVAGSRMPPCRTLSRWSARSVSPGHAAESALEPGELAGLEPGRGARHVVPFRRTESTCASTWAWTPRPRSRLSSIARLAAST